MKRQRIPGRNLPRQKITHRDVQKDLLKKMNAYKSEMIFFTGLVVLMVVALAGAWLRFDQWRRMDWKTVAAVLLIPCGIAVFSYFVIRFYYLKLYRIKKGRFDVTKEELCDKKREWVRHHRNFSREENMLYFRGGRIPVEDEVFANACKGDEFYVVMLRGERCPFLVYHAKYYEIVEE